MATDTHKEDWRDFPGAVIPVKGKDGVRHEAWPSSHLRSAYLPENVKAFLEDQFPEPEKKVMDLIKAGAEVAELMDRGEVRRLIQVLETKMLAKARARR